LIDRETFAATLRTTLLIAWETFDATLLTALLTALRTALWTALLTT
jgi:hypothetical protein